MMSIKKFAQDMSVLSREPLPTLTRQLRFWTDLGGIPIANELAVGSGKARFYTRESMLAAAVAIEMNRWGMPVGSIKKTLTFMVAALRDESTGLMAVANGEDTEWLPSKLMLFLKPAPDGSGEEVVGMALRKENVVKLVGTDDFTSPGDSAFIVDLVRLWGKLPR
jgi:hypothetical protein